MYYASNKFYTHVHNVNGVMITHSHPSSEKDHNHTKNELILICSLNSIEILQPDLLHVHSLNLPILYSLSVNELIPLIGNIHKTEFYLRAPPVH